MGILSPTVSMTRYTIEGKLQGPILETVARGLRKYTIAENDDQVSEKTVGWTSLATSFAPDFEGSSFVMGTHLVFSLRIDKKTVPPKTIKKHCAIQEAKTLSKSGRQYLSRHEKNMIREQVTNTLFLRIPATPNIYDVIWNYEEASLWFFSTLKAANEELETLFLQSFKVPLIRLFPYTLADLAMALTDTERDILADLSATTFLE